jgi:hypothetical protein
MYTDSPEHPQASLSLHTGSFNFIRPSMGSWVVYGLGTENQDLPGFITMNPLNHLGGAQTYGSAFLPATFQGTRYLTKNGKLPFLKNPELTLEAQRKQIDLMQRFNHEYLERQPDNEIEGLIQSYETAFRMQTAVPGILDIEKEPESMKQMYGLNRKETRDFGTQCLLARRLAEAGVRFIELWGGNWDQHNKIKTRIADTSLESDQPIAALLADLKQRGLFRDTLVVWGGEFGRTTTAQQGDGRDHNNRGYSMWMAGGGVKGGMRYGATDGATGAAISGRVHLHDMHATMLHLLGIDHTKLTYRYGGRDFRLTDVHGHVVKDVLV